MILLLAFCRIQQTQDCHLQLVLYSLLLFLYEMTYPYFCMNLYQEKKGGADFLWKSCLILGEGKKVYTFGR